MARGSRRGRRREEEAEPVEAEATEHRGRRGAAPRGLSGPDFALKAGFGAGVVAACLALTGVLIVNKVAGSDTTAVMDLGGVQSVRMLAAIDTDRWNSEFGTSYSVHARIKQAIDEKLAAVEAAGDARDKELLAEPISQFWNGVAADGAAWRPGVFMFLPKDDPNDAAIRAARRSGFDRVQKGGSGALVGMAILQSSGATIATWGEPSAGGTQVASIGETTVAVAPGVRIYEHPIHDRLDKPAGKAVITLSTADAAGPSVMTTAGSAAGLAFLGAFVMAFVICLTPVKALQRLAGESEALAQGELGTRVTVRGPAAVVAIARNLQKLATMAAEGGGAAAQPQVVQQTVHVLPIDEINAALAPSRSFQRADAIEIESTHKSCPDSGNDYHDVVNVPGGKIGLFVADIPVRGLAGAMYMARVQALFRAAAQKSDSPAEVLKKVNRGFAIDLPRGVYVTAMYCVLDPATGICKVASAQHLPLVFWKLERKGSARLQTQGIALGHDAGPVFDKTIEEKAIQLDRGDRVVLFTDGAITAKNAAGAIYGEERFYYVVNRESPKNSAAFVNFVANDVDLFHEGSAQMDDFTVLTARRVK